MLKLTSALLLVVMLIAGTVHSQTLTDPPRLGETNSELREAFAAENEKIKNESAALDARKMNKMQRQTTQNNWSGKKTALVVILTVVIVGALYVIVKNTRRCVRREPSSCDLVNDPDCVCTEYAR